MWSWSCKGGNGQPKTDQSGAYKEGEANLYAFLSMVAPTPAERNAWGCYGRDIWVYVMQQVLSGKEEIKGNHWSDSAPQFALTTDWLMAGNYLSAVRPGIGSALPGILRKDRSRILLRRNVASRKVQFAAQFQENDIYSIVGLSVGWETTTR